jgi:uncharacterized protein YukE
MAEVISAEEGALRRGREAVTAARDAIEGKNREVADAVAGTSSWKGAAARDFQNLMVQWQDKSKSLLTVLDGLNVALGGAETDQAQQEETSQTTITGLGSAMSGI